MDEVLTEVNFNEKEEVEQVTTAQVEETLVAKGQEDSGRGAEEEKEKMEGSGLQTTVVATENNNCVQTDKKVEKNKVVAKQDTKERAKLPARLEDKRPNKEGFKNPEEPKPKKYDNDPSKDVLSAEKTERTSDASGVGRPRINSTTKEEIEEKEISSTQAVQQEQEPAKEKEEKIEGSVLCTNVEAAGDDDFVWADDMEPVSCFTADLGEVGKTVFGSNSQAFVVPDRELLGHVSTQIWRKLKRKISISKQTTTISSISRRLKR